MWPRFERNPPSIRQVDGCLFGIVMIFVGRKGTGFKMEVSCHVLNETLSLSLWVSPMVVGTISFDVDL